MGRFDTAFFSFLFCFSSLCNAATLGTPPKRVAIVTGGTRGIGRGISESLAAQGFDLLLTYNSDADAAAEIAAESAKRLAREYPGCKVECVGGDVGLASTRDAIFECFDKCFGKRSGDGSGGQPLGAVVHNAGQFVGITSPSNVDGLSASSQLGFVDDSLLPEGGGAPSLDMMHRYLARIHDRVVARQRLYGDAFVDLCERGLVRMVDGEGSLVGISSPGSSLHYKPNIMGEDMPGSGCVMEYAMRLFALRAAKKRVNCNVVIPGVTDSDAWGKLAETRGVDREVGRVCPMGTTPSAKEVGDVVAFLVSPQGRAITGASLPADGGVHLKA